MELKLFDAIERQSGKYWLTFEAYDFEDAVGRIVLAFGAIPFPRTDDGEVVLRERPCNAPIAARVLHDGFFQELRARIRTPQ